MLKSKIYTEEQVLRMLEVCRDSDLYEHILTFEDILKTETPIELPSFTDLEKKAFELHKNSLLEFNSYLDGGKFVIDKIAHTK